MVCALCEREVEALTKHHLTPRKMVKRRDVEAGPTILICWACHRQIHGLFDHRELASSFNSVEKLQAEPRMQTFLAWVRKQDGGRRIKVRASRR
ncbi:MAG: hypothetical protein NVSMB42_14810 [Herpetosiphon sp.]